MKPYLIPLLGTAPLLGACADEAHRVLTGPATGDAQLRVAGASQTAAEADWVSAVVSAKVAGALLPQPSFLLPRRGRRRPGRGLALSS